MLLRTNLGFYNLFVLSTLTHATKKTRYYGSFILHSFEDSFGDSLLPGGCWMKRCFAVETLYPWAG